MDATYSQKKIDHLSDDNTQYALYIELLAFALLMFKQLHCDYLDSSITYYSLKANVKQQQINIR